MKMHEERGDGNSRVIRISAEGEGATKILFPVQPLTAEQTPETTPQQPPLQTSLSAFSPGSYQTLNTIANYNGFKKMLVLGPCFMVESLVPTCSIRVCFDRQQLPQILSKTQAVHGEAGGLNLVRRLLGLARRNLVQRGYLVHPLGCHSTRMSSSDHRARKH